MTHHCAKGRSGVEAMAALTAADMLLLSMTSRLDRVQAFFARDRV